MNGQLFAPAIDRKSYGIPGDYAKMDSSGSWAKYNFVSSSTHVYDAVKSNDTVLFMTGSQDERAGVYYIHVEFDGIIKTEKIILH